MFKDGTSKETFFPLPTRMSGGAGTTTTARSTSTTDPQPPPSPITPDPSAAGYTDYNPKNRRASSRAYLWRDMTVPGEEPGGELIVLMERPSNATVYNEDRTTSRVRNIIKRSRNRELGNISGILYLNIDVEGGVPNAWMKQANTNTRFVCATGSGHCNTQEKARAFVAKLRLNGWEGKLFVFKDRTSKKTFFPLPTRMSMDATICRLDNNYLEQITVAREK